jgi:hypothetical protein
MDEFKFVIDQNEGLLFRLFFEQAFQANPIGNVTKRIIERDLGSLYILEENWKRLGNDPRVEWLVLGLSFTDFKFHLFPISISGGVIPFSISPVMSCCFLQSAILQSGHTREAYVNAQWENCDWKIMEQRISCLSEPLDIFGEITDCAEENCQTF